MRSAQSARERNVSTFAAFDLAVMLVCLLSSSSETVAGADEEEPRGYEDADSEHQEPVLLHRSVVLLSCWGELVT